MPLQMLREALEALQKDGDLTVAEIKRLGAALRAVLPRLLETQPPSPADFKEAVAWLLQRGGFQAIFGVGGSFRDHLLHFARGVGESPAQAKALLAYLGRILEEYLKRGRPLTAWVALFAFGWQYHLWDMEARKRWSKPLEALLTSAGEGDGSAVRRLALLGPLALQMVPRTATLLWEKLLARDGDFFLKLGRALKTGVDDRRERRAVGELDDILLGLASIWARGPWSDAELLASFQEAGIASKAMDRTAFKVRRQRLGVRLQPKGRRPSGATTDSGSRHPRGRKGS